MADVSRRSVAGAAATKESARHDLPLALRLWLVVVFFFVRIPSSLGEVQGNRRIVRRCCLDGVRSVNRRTFRAYTELFRSGTHPLVFLRFELATSLAGLLVGDALHKAAGECGAAASPLTVRVLHQPGGGASDSSGSGGSGSIHRQRMRPRRRSRSGRCWCWCWPRAVAQSRSDGSPPALLAAAAKLAATMLFVVAGSFAIHGRLMGGRNLETNGPAGEVRTREQASASPTRSKSNAESLLLLPPPPPCPYRSLADLSPDERDPRATAARHIVDPPHPQWSGSTSGRNTTLVCCHTTAGPISVAVHHPWAPRGAQRFLDMVRSRYFSSPISELQHHHLAVPLMRCVDDFLCQFGLRGNASDLFASKIEDDPSWLPQEKRSGRSNALGVKRFQRGYVAYAGSGPNSRDRQLFVSLADQSGLGTAPWEVPFGELVGRHSYDTLSRIYTGYGEDGPTQESLMTDHGLVEARRDFPRLDWITSCHVVDEDGTTMTQAGGVKIA